MTKMSVVYAEQYLVLRHPLVSNSKKVRGCDGLESQPGLEILLVVSVYAIESGCIQISCGFGDPLDWIRLEET